MSKNIQPSFITIEKLQSEVEDYLNGSLEQKKNIKEKLMNPQKQENAEQKVLDDQQIQDELEIIKKCNYSGVGDKLQDIKMNLKVSQLMEEVEQSNLNFRMSSLDERLLNDQNINFFNDQLKQFFINKGKHLQHDTSLKILKRFLQKFSVETEEKSTQTQSKDPLEQIADMENEINKLKKFIEKQKKELEQKNVERQLYERKMQDLRNLLAIQNQEITIQTEKNLKLEKQIFNNENNVGNDEFLSQKNSAILTPNVKDQKNKKQSLAQKVIDMQIIIKQKDLEINQSSVKNKQMEQQIDTLNEIIEDLENQLSNIKRKKMFEDTTEQLGFNQARPGDGKKINAPHQNTSYGSQFSESGSSVKMTGKIITVKNVDDGENAIEKQIHKDYSNKKNKFINPENLKIEDILRKQNIKKEDFKEDFQDKNNNIQIADKNTLNAQKNEKFLKQLAKKDASQKQSQGSLYLSELNDAFKKEQKMDEATKNVSKSSFTREKSMQEQVVEDEEILKQLISIQGQENTLEVDYTHFMKKPFNQLVAGEKLLQNLIKNRRSKIEYKLSSKNFNIDQKELYFNQSTQTIVDTNTFLKILDMLNKYKI